jgi:hypothetical protein
MSVLHLTTSNKYYITYNYWYLNIVNHHKRMIIKLQVSMLIYAYKIVYLFYKYHCLVNLSP